MKMVTIIYFFDAHGNLWASCANEAEGAHAFGPTGAAVPVEPEEMGLHVTEVCRTPAAAALEQGRAVRLGDWMVLDASPEEILGEVARLERELEGALVQVAALHEEVEDLTAALDAACWQADGCMDDACGATGMGLSRTRVHVPEEFIANARAARAAGVER